MSLSLLKHKHHEHISNNLFGFNFPDYLKEIILIIYSCFSSAPDVNWLFIFRIISYLTK